MNESRDTTSRQVVQVAKPNMLGNTLVRDKSLNAVKDSESWSWELVYSSRSECIRKLHFRLARGGDTPVGLKASHRTRDGQFACLLRKRGILHVFHYNAQ